MNRCLTVALITFLPLCVDSQWVCDNAYQCINETITYIEPVPITIILLGYKALFGPQSTINLTSTATQTVDIHCDGALSCALSSFLGVIAENGEIRCYGSNACENTSMTSPFYRCQSLNACIRASIQGDSERTDNEVQCFGEASCAYSTFTEIQHIAAAGAFSLYKATIDSQNTLGPIAVYLQGHYAGYGATLICRTGSICNIHCRGMDSCTVFHIICQGTCNFYTSSGVTVTPVIINNTNVTRTVPDIIEIINTDDDCNTYPGSVTFDNANELPPFTNISHNAPVCCRADSSCTFANIDLAATPFIACMADAACRDSVMFNANNHTVLCEATSSCDTTRIFGPSRLHCRANFACASAEIRGAKYISVTGRYGFDGGIYWSNGSDVDIYFSAVNAGRGATIHCQLGDTCNIYCTTSNSCPTTATVYCQGTCNVSCDTSSDCPIQIQVSVPPSSIPSANPTKNPTQSTNNPTKNPTQLTNNPTKSPSQSTKNPTQSTNYPSQSTNNPTNNPSQLTNNPTNNPTQPPSNGASRDPSLQPSASPTKTPISDAVVTNYEISIDINDCDNDDDTPCELDEDTLQTVIDATLSVQSATVYIEVANITYEDDQVVVWLSVTTSEDNVLETDFITYHVEREIKDVNELGDVDVEEKGDGFDDIPQNDTNPLLFLLVYARNPIIMGISGAVICCICCTLLMICVSHTKRKRVVQLEKMISESAIGNTANAGGITTDAHDMTVTTPPGNSDPNGGGITTDAHDMTVTTPPGNSDQQPYEETDDLPHDDEDTSGEDEDEELYDNDNNQLQGNTPGGKTPGGNTPGKDTREDA